MRYFAQILFFFFSLNMVVAQSNKQIYGELLGNGVLIGSLNYDQRFTNAVDGLGFRVGVGLQSLGPAEFTFPIMINYLRGEKHQLEIGAGIVFLTQVISFQTGDDLDGLAFTGSVMYRLNFDSGWVFRVGYTPVFDKTSLPAWLGISIGRKI